MTFTGGETRCPWCRSFFPDSEISAHKAMCGDNPANK